MSIAQHNLPITVFTVTYSQNYLSITTHKKDKGHPRTGHEGTGRVKV